MRTIIAFMSLALYAGAATAQAERVALPALPGFVVGHQLERGGNAIVEHIPRGETVQAWTRMVTVQRFGGVASRISPQTLLQNMIRGLANGCPGARTSPIQPQAVSGRTAAQFRADCPRNPQTRLPETFIARAIAGQSDLHVVQVAFRRVPTAADLRWAQEVLGGVTLAR